MGTFPAVVKSLMEVFFMYCLSGVHLTFCMMIMGDLAGGSPRLVALGILGALTKLKSTGNDLPYTSQVALGLSGQCNAQASKVAHCPLPV